MCRLRGSATLLAALAASACGTGKPSPGPGDPVDPDLIASAIIGPDGGRLEGEGVALDVPAGALQEPTRLTIRLVPAPDDFAFLSPVYGFEPSGLELEVPATVLVEAPSAPVGSVLLWTALGDDTRFEPVGFVELGAAIADVNHFSQTGVVTGDGGAPVGDPSEECPPEVENGGTCPQACDATGDASPACAGDATCEPNLEPCRRLCYCTSDTGDRLCPTNPGGPDYAPNLCVDTPLGDVLGGGVVERPSESYEMLGLRDDEGCNGYLLVGQFESVCDCEMVVPYRNATPEPTIATCKRAWEVVDGTTRCSTNIDGDAPRSQAEDLATRAFREVDGGENFGHYIDYLGQPQWGICRRVINCAETFIGRSDWVEAIGLTSSCGRFGWPSGAPPEGVEIDRARCRLTQAEWDLLQARRAECGMSADPDDPNGRTTMAILTAPEGQYTGVNGRTGGAQPVRAAAGPQCAPSARVTGDGRRFWGGGPSNCHAEGDALEQLAIARNREPAPPNADYPRGRGAAPGVGTEGGSAILIEDRDPCVMSCAPRGVNVLRETAGLEQIDVHAPSGRVRYGPGLPASGLPLD